MKVTLLDFKNRRSAHNIGPKKSIETATIEIRSGDEVLFVLYKNGKMKTFDSSDDRWYDLNYGHYLAFSAKRNINVFINKEWKKRESSDDWPQQWF